MTARWTRPHDIVAKVRRRWADGSLLVDHAAGAPFPALDLPLRGPRASEIGDDLGAVQDWVRELDTGQREGRSYTLEWTSVGGRHVGRNRVPSRARVSTYAQAWTLLGVQGEVRAFEEVQAVVAGHDVVTSWVATHPHAALGLRDSWPQLVAAHTWLDEHRGSQRYLREITAPGVDTKFAERHRVVLADLLGVPAGSAAFLEGLGLRSKPQLMRVRVSPGLGLPHGLSELALRPEELARLELRPRSVLVVENEISYLSVPVPGTGLVLWGKGFDVDRVGRLPWLTEVPVTYWGDLDTHGFAILDRLRAWLPQTRSVLMDRGTLLRHRDRWGSEDRPATSRLNRLTEDESDLYAALVGGHLGERVRLEQERIDWAWVVARLPRGEV